MMNYNEKVERYSLDAFDYAESIYDFVDDKYKTKYNECKMNDELDRLDDEIINNQDFETVQKIYELACKMYPLVAECSILNPKHRLVNSWYIFKNTFGKLLEELEYNYTGETLKIKLDEITDSLIKLFPQCEKMIILHMKIDIIPDENESIWLIPKDEILNEQYRELYQFVL